MTEEERQDADVILTKLDEYFVPKQNTIYEWYVFNCCSQKLGESFDQFLTELANLWLRASLVHLKVKCFVTTLSLVCEIMDTAKSATGTTLTLQKAIDICRTNEMAASQQLKMEQTDTVHLIHGNETCTRHADPCKNHRQIINCKYCRDSHVAGNCPAFGKTCTKCNKKIILQKSFAPPPNTVMRNQRRNLKMSASE